MSEFTAAPEFKAAMVAAAHTIWDAAEPDVQISYGHPGKTQHPDIVGFSRVTSEQDPATLSTNRSREETLQLVVTFSIYRFGGPEMEEVATVRAYKLLGDLENYVRKTDTTLGGVVRHCFLQTHESDGESDPNVLAQGRLIEVQATFQAQNRITTT
ncbi:hypothetical protein [Herbiconiux sp. VKM Ac-2851]|uniref:hypothetical protein n=1 Tax=Herbiconiux sp. VKM Ac-2851 TaxID=2739025 RepID=UPI00156626ED|nr:hypothetical protein [Herbiconiux sp. VKM Ac-2851]NQX36253.1 hypothetical protein [Herbiconiux sp. VKM Ac-2851]